MKKMNKKTFDTLREITKAEEVQKEAVYYSIEYAKEYRFFMRYHNLYNENFELIEVVKVKYTDAIKHLKRVVSENHKDDLALAAYTLEDIGNGFCHVISNESTMQGLTAISSSVCNVRS